MSAEKRVAFNTQLYQNSSPNTVAKDIASLTVEATKRNGNIIDPENIWWFHHLPEKLSTKQDLFPSSLAALDVERHIKETPENSQRLIVLVSPAYDYPEGRLDIYFVTNSHGFTSFDAYGIPLLEPPDATERRLLQFTPRSTTPNLPHLSGPDAVMTPLMAEISANEDIFRTASTWIDLPTKVWQQIQSGEIRKRCIELTELAEKCVAPAVLSGLKNNENPYITGARAEQQMSIASGITVDYTGSGCGASNSEFLETSTNTHAETNRPSPEYVFVRYCGACCGSINRLLSSGDACPHCQQEFRPKKPPVHAQPFPVSGKQPEVSTSSLFLPPTMAFSWLSEWWKILAKEEVAIYNT